VRKDFSDAVAVRLVKEPPKEELEEVKREPPKPPEPKQRPEFTPELLQPSLARFESPDIGVVVDASRFGSSLDGEFVFDMEDVDERARVIYRREPEYPYMAMQRGTEGVVIVKFLVAADGTVRHVEILEARPKGVFEEAVLKVVPTWKFEPGRIDGKPVSSLLATQITFQMP
jgi:protein TonB